MGVLRVGRTFQQVQKRPTAEPRGHRKETFSLPWITHQCEAPTTADQLSLGRINQSFNRACQQSRCFDCFYGSFLCKRVVGIQKSRGIENKWHWQHWSHQARGPNSVCLFILWNIPNGRLFKPRLHNALSVRPGLFFPPSPPMPFFFSLLFPCDMPGALFYSLVMNCPSSHSRFRMLKSCRSPELTKGSCFRGLKGHHRHYPQPHFRIMSFSWSSSFNNSHK